MSYADFALGPEELVNDHALSSANGDQFAHADFAQELTELVCSVPTPANVALFAPWGSGKTGLGNLLKEGLAGRKGVRFVRFDAFKYAEAPLRRHFISQVAKALDERSDRYSEDLYRQRENRTVRFSRDEQLKLALAFAKTLVLVALVLLVVASAVAGLVALADGRRFTTEWSYAVREYLLATVPVAAVITAFIKLASDGLVLNSTRSAPSGEEEFEKVFTELVEKVKADRLVIFIDELDRCSAEQVVSTLETLKTFLEVPGCVFVVAADLQVLEQALRKDARQETPSDSSNPYYSSGSSYLDKVFQYQMALPPLKPRRLTAFALSLVTDRPGVWQRVQNLDEVISVLVPTHVTSPRRVKVLLNSYALSYRLAERRAAEGMLAANLSERASEMAKLVCLRCEFPLFASDLTMDQRLPYLVRRLADGESAPDDANSFILSRARAYAHGLLPVGELLVEEPLAPSMQELEEPFELDAPDDVGEEEEPDEVDEARPAATNADDALPPVGHEYALQLVRYLRKVAYVTDPRADLIYLESAGASVALDPAVADELERAAIDGDVRLVIERVSSLDEQDRSAAIQLLANLVRESPVGLEGQNAVSTLLRAITETRVDLDGIADTVADAVAGHQSRVRLRDEDLAGALTLALASDRQVGRRLRDDVLATAGAPERPDVAVVLLAGVGKLPAGFDAQVGDAATSLMLDSTRTFTESVPSLDDDQVRRVFVQMRRPLRAAIGEMEVEARGALQSVFEEVLGAAANTGREVLHVAAFAMALSTDAQEARHAVSNHVNGFEEVADAELASLLLIAATTRRSADQWPQWLGVLDAGTVAQLDGVADVVGRAAAKLWTNLASPASEEVAPDSQWQGVQALARLVGSGVPTEPSHLLDQMRQQLDGAFSSDAAVQSQRDALEQAGRFIEASLIDAQTVADLDLSCCDATVRSQLPPTVPPATSRQVVAAAADERITRSASAASLTALDEVRDALLASPWLASPRRDELLLTVAAWRKASDPGTESPFNGAEIAELRRQHGFQFDDGLATWVRSFSEAPDEMWAGLRETALGSVPELVATALRARSEALSAPGKYALVRPALDEALTSPPDPSFLRAVRFSEADAGRAVSKLIELAGDADGSAQLGVVLTLWRELSPANGQERQRLIDDIYLPLLRRGSDGVALGIEFFGLVSSATGATRRAVRNALRDNAGDDEQKHQVDERLREAGWLRRSLFGFGPLVESESEDEQ